MAYCKRLLGFLLLAALATLLLASSIYVVHVAEAEVVEVDTFLYLMVAPNPAGVGQTVLITFQLDKPSPLAFGVLEKIPGSFFQGFTIKITKPDGTVETKGPLKAWATSGAFIFYTPDQEGTYRIQASFPGQWINTTAFAVGGWRPNTQYWFKPSVSREVELIVQSQPPEPYPEVPLPTDYWTRPIYGENKGWWQVADNWLMQGYDYLLRFFPGYTAFAPYTDAPESPHVLWKKPIWFGGIAGGQFGDKSFYTGLSYEQPYAPLILCGRIIYVEHDPADETNIIGTRCLDLYTGEEIWFLEDVSIDFAQIYDIENPNEHGLIAHLWDISGPPSNTTARLYDAFTGKYQFTITNITWGGLRGTTFGPRGEILSWSIVDAGSNRRLILWNSSKAIHEAFPWIGGEVGEIYDPIMGSVVDGRLGIQLNTTIPPTPGTIYYISVKEGIIITYASDTSTFPITWIHAAYDAWTGRQLWVKNRTNIYMKPYTVGPGRPTAIGEGIYVQADQAKMQIHAYDIRTGEELWVSKSYTEVTNTTDWAYFTRAYDIAYGKVYCAGYDGHVRAFDAKTGELVWDFYFGNAGTETPYGSWPVYNGFTIADGKIYVANDEHSPDSVLWRGGRLWCIDAETGELLWSLSGWLRIPVIADGFLTACNAYDNQIYVIGKGPSATEVSAPQVAVTVGSTVLHVASPARYTCRCKGEHERLDGVPAHAEANSG